MSFSVETRSSKLQRAASGGAPASSFCLIRSLFSDSSPGTRCWCPTNRAPAAAGAPQQLLGVPFFFISALISSVGGSTSWKAVAAAPHLRQHCHPQRRYCCSSTYLCRRIKKSPEQRTCDSNLEHHVNLISNHVASISWNGCCFGSKQKQYESLTQPW